MEGTTTGSADKPALRAGGQTLMLLAASLNVEILRYLEQGPRSLQNVRSRLGLPPQSTMRLHLRTLSAIGAIERRVRNEFPTSAEFEITEAGRALLEVGAEVHAWLQSAPGGSVELASTGATSAIKALVSGWSSHVVRILAARPLSLTELDSLIPRISYPSLERRLTAMRECGLVGMPQARGRLKPYEVTEWLRRATIPVTAAIGWERTYALDSTPPVGRLDVEAVFLLAVPLLELPPEVNGRCRLAVEVHDGASPVFAGVVVCIEAGEVTSCVANLEAEAEAWASGKPLSWLRQLNMKADDELEVGGDRTLARSLLGSLPRTAGELQRP